jgi:squalene synthase HpnC
MAKTIENAYQSASELANKHYENFPVGSFLLPRQYRKAIHLIYAFARSADDIADEGDLSSDERLKQLDQYWQALKTLEQKKIVSKESNEDVPPLFVALKEVIEKHQLPYSLFFDLLRAFKQDVLKKDYQNFDEILEYCHYSAKPIGRLLLHLTKQNSPENIALSDALCSCLQIINFIQDIQSDLVLRDRLYFPRDEMQKYGIQKQDLLDNLHSDNITQFFHFQTLLAKDLLQHGATLPSRLPGLFGFEIRLIVAAANHLIKKLLQRKNIYERPIIRFWHWPGIVFKAVFCL